ncbi:twin-arginine translocase TatA/TatE family subunit [Pedobacter steynii]
MLHNTLLAALGTQEILVILVVVLLLFGGKKIPELMSGLGKGIREFNNGKDGVDEAGGNLRRILIIRYKFNFLNFIPKFHNFIQNINFKEINNSLSVFVIFGLLLIEN